MNILLTGQNGYLGTKITEFLNKKHNIIGFDSSYKESTKNKFKGNLINKDDIHQCITKYGHIDLILHLAALSGVEKDVSEYDNYVNNNILGTFNLLETMVKFNIKKILFSSSCACYGNNQNSKEWDNTKPESFYGVSKLIGEDLIEFYGRNHGFKYNIFRIFNVIGRGGESDFNNNRLIPTLINNITTNKDITLFLQSNKKDTCLRDYVDIKFVCEVFNGFINKQTNKIINIGSGQGVSGKDMTEKMFKLLGKKVNINYSNKRKGDPDKSVSNNERLENLGFKYNKSIEEIARE